MKDCCCVLHGICNTAATDHRDCDFLIVGVFVCPLCASNQSAKNVSFLPTLYRSRPVKRKDWIQRSIVVLSMELVALLLLINENVVF